MIRLTLLISLAGVILLPATPLTAQEAQPNSALLRAATETLKSDLRNFVTAQEVYFANHTTYARSLHDMGETYRASRGVTVVLLTSSDTGHSEIAIDERVPGLVCAMCSRAASTAAGRRGRGSTRCRAWSQGSKRSPTTDQRRPSGELIEPVPTTGSRSDCEASAPPPGPAGPNGTVHWTLVPSRPNATP